MKISKFIYKMGMFGSRVICSPPPKDTDEDWIVYTQNMEELIKDLQFHGFTPDITEAYGDSPFSSYRREEVNFVITDDDRFYNATIKATAIAKELNLTDREDRYALFKIVRRAYGENKLLGYE